MNRIKKIICQHKYYLIILIFSLLSLIPFGFLISNIFRILKIITAVNVDIGEAQDILSKTWSDPAILYPFLVGLVIWCGGAIASAYFLAKKQVNASYALITLIFGGIGIHLLAFGWMILKTKKVWSFKTQKVIVGNTIIGATIALPTAFFVASFAYQGMEKPTKAAPINFSLNTESPNLIEIFTDGFDQANLATIKTNDAFNDFTWFTNFQTANSLTHLSVPTIYGDFLEYNPFAIMRKYNLTSDAEYKDFVYGQGWLESGVKHMQMEQERFGQRTIVNPTTFSNRSDFVASNSGTPEAISALDKTINVANWTATRDDLANNWGASYYSPDASGYQWVGQKSQYQSNQGARVFLLDLITHRSYLTGNNGEFSPWNFRTEDQLGNLQNQMASLFNALKTMQVNNQSVYDNSLIVVYGDHGNHEQELLNPENANHRFSNMQSALMIKYPQQKQKQVNVVSDRYVYSPQINTIISDYFTSNEFTNANFGQSYFADAKFNNVARPIFLGPQNYQMAHWENGWLVPVSDQVIHYDASKEYYQELAEVQYE